MTAYLLRRMMQTVVLVAVMSVIVFFGVHVIGDPIWLLVNPQMDQKDIEAAVRALGLDRPIWQQYLTSSTARCTAISAAPSSSASRRSRSSSSACRRRWNWPLPPWR